MFYWCFMNNRFENRTYVILLCPGGTTIYSQSMTYDSLLDRGVGLRGGVRNVTNFSNNKHIKSQQPQYTVFNAFMHLQVKWCLST